MIHRIKKNYTLLLLVGLGVLFLGRIVLLTNVYQYSFRSINVDSNGYLRMADGVEEFGRFVTDDPKEDLLRTPGYPAFIWLIQQVFDDRIIGTVTIQVVLTFFIALMLYQSGRIAGHEKIGLIAAYLYAINPNALIWSMQILTETLFCFLITASFMLLIGAIQHQARIRFTASGVLLGLATLTRPIGIYLLPLWLLIMVIALIRKGELRDYVGGLLFFLIATLAIIFPWQLKNLIKHGEFTVSSTTEITINSYIAAHLLSDALDISRDEAKAIILSKPDSLAYSYQLFWEYPVSFLRTTVNGTLRTLLGADIGQWMTLIHNEIYYGKGMLEAILDADISSIKISAEKILRSETGKTQFGLLLWSVAYSFFIFISALIGLYKVTRYKNWIITCVTWMAVFSAAYLTMIPLSNGDARFRVPAAGLLALLSAMAFINRKTMLESEPKIKIQEGTQ